MAATLLRIGTHPNASSREIAASIGIGDEAQVSRLLARMKDLGWVANRTVTDRRGRRYAWHLTVDGRRVVQAKRGPRVAALPDLNRPERHRRSNSDVRRVRLERTQRERLIDAMVELSAKHAYHEVSITELCSHAGVSSQSFYEQFQSKEDCFLVAYRHCGERILGRTRALAAESGEWCEAARRALGVLLENVQSDPDAGRVLFIGSLGGGPLIRAERERVFLEFELGAEVLLARTPADRQTLDIPALAVIGALRHVISRHLRTRREYQLPALLEDGLTWLSSYAAAGGSERWSTSPAALIDRGPPPPTPLAWTPETLPPGNHGLPAGAIARSQHTRLIFATAEVTLVKGYQNAMVTDIVARARVGRNVFYRHFASKHEAFLEAQARPVQCILERCAEAYFAAGEWPERVWGCLQTLIELIVANPAISHLCLIESYAAGPVAIRRAEALARSFTIFLAEGYHYREQAHSLPRLCSQASAAAIVHIIGRCVAERDGVGLAARMPQLTYLAIAPFTGAAEAIVLVEELKARERERSPENDPRCGRREPAGPKAAC